MDEIEFLDIIEPLELNYAGLCGDNVKQILNMEFTYRIYLQEAKDEKTINEHYTTILKCAQTIYHNYQTLIASRKKDLKEIREKLKEKDPKLLKKKFYLEWRKECKRELDREIEEYETVEERYFNIIKRYRKDGIPINIDVEI